MPIKDIKVTRRKSGTCVEFVGQDGASIEIELHGDDLADMSDKAIIARARETMNQIGKSGEEPREDAGVDQTLDTP